MGINSLEEPQGNPGINGDDVQVVGQVAVQQRATNGTSAENEDLSGVRIFGSETEGCRVLVVNLVDMSVKGTIMKSLMS